MAIVQALKEPGEIRLSAQSPGCSQPPSPSKAGTRHRAKRRKTRMDIFAHGLWTAAIATGVNRKIARPLRVGWAVFFGVFPDLFAFAPPSP